jgi:hypothetical protein
MQLTGNRFVWLRWWNACRPSVGRAAGAILVGALLFTPALAADEAPVPAGPMIPPGQEELLLAMLGKGMTLAGCTLTGGEVVYTTITATYACAGGPAVFELSHPSTAARSAIQTAQFALTLQSGSPPRSLADALVSLIRSREDAFEWEILPGADDAPEGDAGDQDE